MVLSGFTLIIYIVDISLFFFSEISLGFISDFCWIEDFKKLYLLSILCFDITSHLLANYLQDIAKAIWHYETVITVHPSFQS